MRQVQTEPTRSRVACCLHVRGGPKQQPTSSHHLGARLLVHRKRSSREADRDAGLLALGRDGRFEIKHPPPPREGVVGPNRPPVVRVVGAAAVAHAELIPIALRVDFYCSCVFSKTPLMMQLGGREGREGRGGGGREKIEKGQQTQPCRPGTQILKGMELRKRSRSTVETATKRHEAKLILQRPRKQHRQRCCAPSLAPRLGA